MKKLTLALGALLLLAGCSDASVDISFNDTLFTVEGTVIKEKDLFNVMKQHDAGVMGSTVVIDSAREALIKDIEVSDDMKKEAAEQLAIVKEMFGDKFADTLKEIGFDSEEDYLETMVYPELKYNQLVKKEIVEDFESLNEEYAPRQVRILELNQDVAEEALQEIKDGEDFDLVAEKHQLIASQFNGSKQVQLLKTTQVPEAVAEFLKRNEGPTLSGVLIPEVSTEAEDAQKTAYIVQIIEVDATRFQDETIEAYLGTQAVVEEYKGLLFRKNNFKVYDRDIYDSILETQAQYLEENKEQ